MNEQNNTPFCGCKHTGIKTNETSFFLDFFQEKKKSPDFKKDRKRR